MYLYLFKKKEKTKKQKINDGTTMRALYTHFLKDPGSATIIKLPAFYGQSPLIFMASTTLLTASTVLALRMLTPYFSDV